MGGTSGSLGFLGLFLAALLGSFTAYLGQWAKLWLDEWSSRSDEIVDAILALATSGSEYWATDYSQEVNKQAIAEAAIVGQSALLTLLLNPVMQRLPQVYKSDLLLPVADFIGAVTGGDFRDSGREPDLHRVRDCHVAAASAIAAVRVSHRRAVQLRIRIGLACGYLG